MTRLIRYRNALCFALVAGGTLVGLSGCASTVPATPKLDATFHFGYIIHWTGPTASRPVQVFSDATRTYFQLATSTTPAPTFFALSPQGLTPVTAVRNGQYLVTRGTAAQWTLMSGGGRGTVSAPSGVNPTIELAQSPASPPVMPHARALPTYSAGEADALGDNIQSLKNSITTLDRSIADGKRHLYEHPGHISLSTEYSLAILFHRGSSTVGARTLARVSQMARLAAKSYRITLRGVATPSGGRTVNLALSLQRVVAVKKILLGLGVPTSAMVVLPAVLDGRYPHVALHFAITHEETGQ